MDFISGLVGLALVAVAAITSWLDRLPAWLIPGLIALWIVETKSNAIEGTVTEAMRELKAIRATVDNIDTVDPRGPKGK